MYSSQIRFASSAVCVTHDGSSAANTPVLYIKGVATTTANYQTASGSFTDVIPAPVTMSNAVDAFTGSFDGKIDDVRLYNRVLSAAEVQQSYNTGLVSVGKAQTNYVPSGLVGYWSFNGKDTHWNTNTTDDLSGQGNTDTMVSMSNHRPEVPTRPWKVQVDP